MTPRLPSAGHVADCILISAKFVYDTDLDQMQLNKLCHLVNGFTLRERDEPAFYNAVEAWKYGPVIPEVYEAYKSYGKGAITVLDMCRTGLENEEAAVDRWKDLYPIIGDQVASIIHGVVKEYSKYSGWELAEMTHKRRTPWKKVYRPGHNKIIPTSVIREFYKNLTADDDGR